MHRIRSLMMFLVSLLVISCGDMYDSAKKSILNDLLLFEMPVYSLYVSNYDSGATYSNISTFQMNSDGTLNPVSYLITEPRQARSILAHPDKYTLYAVLENIPGRLVAFTIGLNGALTGDTKSLFEFSNPYMLNSLVFTPGSNNLHVGMGNNAAIYGFWIMPDGSFVGGYNEDPSLEIGGIPSAYCLANHPNNKYCYVGMANVRIYKYTYNYFGFFEKGSDAASTNLPTNILVDQSGRYLYYIESGLQSIFKMDLDLDGDIVASSLTVGPSVGTPIANFEMHPSGRYIFSSDDSNISVFGINSLDGTLNLIYQLPSPGAGGILKVHPNGSFLYMSSINRIYVFSIDQTSGTISLIYNYPSTISPLPHGTINVFSMTIGAQKIPFLIDTKRFRK